MRWRNFFIDPMREEHIGRLPGWKRLLFLPAAGRSAARGAHERYGDFFFTAVCEGTVAGYAGMHCILDEGYIDNIAVFLPTGGRRLQARC